MLKIIQLKTIFYLLVGAIIFSGCSDASTTLQDNGADSTKNDSSFPVSKSAEDHYAYNEEEEMKKLVMEFSQMCENPVIKDTLFIIGSDTISVALNHSCTGDSFPLPAKYLEMYKLDRFMAHSLKTDIVVEKNGERIAQKRILKMNFESLLEPSLKEYAVLWYGYMGTVNDTIYIDYSITIPLTDIGIGVRASILKDGSIQYGRN